MVQVVFSDSFGQIEIGCIYVKKLNRKIVTKPPVSTYLGYNNVSFLQEKGIFGQFLSLSSFHFFLFNSNNHLSMISFFLELSIDKRYLRSNMYYLANHPGT